MSGVDSKKDDLPPGMFGVGPGWDLEGHPEATRSPRLRYIVGGWVGFWCVTSVTHGIIKKCSLLGEAKMHPKGIAKLIHPKAQKPMTVG